MRQFPAGRLRQSRSAFLSIIRAPTRRGFIWVVAVAISGCGTLTGDMKQPITIHSKPIGATATIDGTTRYLTPVRIHLPARRSHTIVVEKEGYQPHTAHVGRRLSVAVLLWNVIVSLGLGEIVDLATGAAWEFTPDYVKTDLTPIRP